MAKLTAADIWGPNWKEQFEKQDADLKDALDSIRDARAAGIDVDEQERKIKEARSQFEQVKRVYGQG